MSGRQPEPPSKNAQQKKNGHPPIFLMKADLKHGAAFVNSEIITAAAIFRNPKPACT